MRWGNGQDGCMRLIASTVGQENTHYDSRGYFKHVTLSQHLDFLISKFKNNCIGLIHVQPFKYCKTVNKIFISQQNPG